MTSQVIEGRAWTRRRWALAVGAVIGVQVLLILLLENRSSAVPRKTYAAADIRWVDHISLAPLAVGDPTLFVFPHAEGFSGEGWLNRSYSPQLNAPVLTEPPRLLALSAETLGASFREFVASNVVPTFAAVSSAAPAIDAPVPFAMPTVAAKSELRIEGGLKDRRLLAEPQLHPWTNSELLTNTIVQVLVNGRGDVVSSNLRQSCGLKAADDFALNFCQTARFEPIGSAATAVAFGTMTFVWQTLPPPATNAVPPIQ